MTERQALAARIKIYSNHAIELDGTLTGWYVAQTHNRTLLYKADTLPDAKHPMSKSRYSLAFCGEVKPACGYDRADFSADLIDFLQRATAESSRYY